MIARVKFTGRRDLHRPFNQGYLTSMPSRNSMRWCLAAMTLVTSSCRREPPRPTLTIDPATLPYAVRDAAYHVELSAAGGTAPYLFSLNSGALPDGLQLDSQGLLSGRPTRSQSAEFVVHVVDSASNETDVTYPLSVDEPPFALMPATLPRGSAGLPYVVQLEARGGLAPLTFTVVTGTLPEGLTLSEEGRMYGWLVTAGTTSFEVRVTDARGNVDARAYTLEITSPPFQLGPSVLPVGRLGLPYSAVLDASGGQGPYDFALVNGALPPGVFFENGALSGTPTTLGTFQFLVTATDQTNTWVTNVFDVAVGPAEITVEPDTTPSVATSSPYSVQFTASGGAGPYRFTLKNGQLPAGLALSAEGLLSGTTGATEERTTFSFSVTDTGGNDFTVGYLLDVSNTVVTLEAMTLPDGVIDGAYPETQLTVTGGAAPYSFLVTAGRVPLGMQLSTNGTLMGYPSLSGTFRFTVAAVDANSLIAHRVFALTVH
jgi:hypothetical protein